MINRNVEFNIADLFHSYFNNIIKQSITKIKTEPYEVKKQFKKATVIIGFGPFIF